jgi:hypothetical protein
MCPVLSLGTLVSQAGFKMLLHVVAYTGKNHTKFGLCKVL